MKIILFVLTILFICSVNFDYPYNEFGMIVGETDKISAIPDEMYFSADVSFRKVSLQLMVIH
jgi:hypothetical protein